MVGRPKGLWEGRRQGDTREVCTLAVPSDVNVVDYTFVEVEPKKCSDCEEA